MLKNILIFKQISFKKINTMDKKTMNSIRLIKKLRELNIWIKIFILFVYSISLCPFFINDETFRTYSFLLFGIVIIMASLYRIVFGKKKFGNLFFSWLIGASIYILVSVFLIYSNYKLSPYLKLDNLTDRWIYTLALPIRILGIFIGGLFFIEVVSPIQFLKWKNFGYNLALLFRVIELSKQKIHETQIALLMQNDWPERGGKFIRFGEAISIIKKCPKLVIVVIRNLLVWCPSAWISFKRLKTNFRGGCP
jgi:hypothetical protein